MKHFLMISASLLIAAPVCAQSVGEKTGANSVLGAAPSTQDFVTEAAQGDMFEIQSSQLVATHSTSAKTNTFAQQMISDHQKTTAMLQPLAAAANATPPTTMSASQQNMLKRLQGLNGSRFTSQYDSDQVSAHRTAVSLYQRYANGGDNADIKNFTSQTLPTLQNHLTMAQTLSK
jgi:putative membrane protein